MLKPDAFERNVVGRILAQFDFWPDDQAKLSAIMTCKLTRDGASLFYAEHAERPFFADLLEYMTRGPVVVLRVTSQRFSQRELVRFVREKVGATDPVEAAAGTLRQLFGTTINRNTIHASDSPAAAERELDFFFGELSRGAEQYLAECIELP